MTQTFSKALVVDDSRMARTTLAKLLTKRDIEVDTADSGIGAVEYMDTNQVPDIVFMDYTMPDIDGLEAVRRIRERHGDGVPTVMYTGHDEAQDRERARQVGIDAFLPKPASDELLGEILDHFAAAGATPAATAAEEATAAEALDEEPQGAHGLATAEDGDAATSEPAAPERDLTQTDSPATSATTETETAAAEPPSATVSSKPDQTADVEAEDDTELSAEPPALGAAPTPRSRTTAVDGESDGDHDPLTAAREAARAIAEEAAMEAVEAKARAIAEAAAREAAEPIAREAGTAAAKQEMDTIRENVKGQVNGLLDSKAFSQRVASVFVQSAWPSVRAEITGEVTEALRGEMQQIARQASAPDRGRPVEEATRQAKQMVNERSNELRTQLNKGMAQSHQQLEAKLKRLILMVGGGLGAALLLGLGGLLLIS